jgi:hypothetical protein
MSEHNDELRFILQNLQAESDEIQGLSIISVQGLPIVSIMDESISETLTSAMAAAIQSVGERAADELKRGKLKRILLDGDQGTLILTAAGEHAILVSLIVKEAAVGVIFMLIDSAVKKIGKVLDS